MRGQREATSERTPAEGLAQLRWRRVFPGEGTQLGLLRGWLRDLLPECGAREDVITVASELGANAVCHTASGRGGQFSVEVIWSASAVQIVVGDAGGPGKPRIIDDPDSENGRGLRVVQALSSGMGVTGGERGRFVHADVPWAANGGPWPAGGAQRKTPADLLRLPGQFPRFSLRSGLAARRWRALIVPRITARLSEFTREKTAPDAKVPAGFARPDEGGRPARSGHLSPPSAAPRRARHAGCGTATGAGTNCSRGPCRRSLGSSLVPGEAPARPRG